MIEDFQQALEAVHGEFIEAENPEEAARIINREIIKPCRGSVMAEPSPLLQSLLSRGGAELEFYRPDTDRKTLAAVEIGIVEAAILVAETGSAIVGADHPGTRTLSLLPPTTVLVAPASTLVPDIPSAVSRMDDKGNMVWITGPSCTADIEKVLVLGVHGPARLIVLLVHKPV